jgi:phosphatidylglycerol lysyltransferase
MEILELSTGGFVGVRRVGRWAVMPSDPIAPPHHHDDAIVEAIDRLASSGHRPIFAAVASDRPYRALRLWSEPIADDPIVDLASFTLEGPAMASVRDSATSARRRGLVVQRVERQETIDLTSASERWLATKRGGEWGFTLGKFANCLDDARDVFAAIEPGSDRAYGFVTWRSYDDGNARVLDLMRRQPDAPNPTMDLLIVESLTRFAATGVRQVSLGAVPRSMGRAADHFYPTATLRRYKSKFGPKWAPRYLITPSRRLTPAALAAVARAYSDTSIWTCLRHNR